MAQVILSDIFIYPVKSLAGIKVSKWTVNNKGLLHDRKWMLIDNHNQFLSQRRLPKMTLIKTEMKNDTLILSTATSGSISLPLNPENGDDINTTIWKDQCLARHPRYISPWDIHVQRFIPLGRLNRVPQYVLRPVSTPHKSR
ncbi:MAG: MOSC N-terminal beta barrel domain-containing protein, partial [Methylococcaceae bacterium]